MVLWDRVFREIAEEYDDIQTESLLVDAAAMNFVRRPESFDVVVASNLFGDILSDLAAIVTGSIGLAPSGNLDPARRCPSLFEPVHGSAPDIAGQGVANPLAAILAAAMMMEHLEESGMAACDPGGRARRSGLRRGTHAGPRWLGHDPLGHRQCDREPGLRRDSPANSHSSCGD